jgi:hypothetical protein
MRRLVLGLVAVAASGFAATATGAVSPGGVAVSVPRSIAPSTVAWYDASRPSAITPAAPMPGVGPKDVLVEGITINTALLPISLPIPTIREVTAFTALKFDLPNGATPAGLTLHLTGLSTAVLDGKLPSGVTPIACPATTSFKAGPQQPTSEAPKYDCSKRSTVGQLSDGGKTVTFPGISRLATGKTLSVVILPGSLGLERLVFSAPDKTTLSLLDFGAQPGITLPHVPLPTATTPGGLSPAGSAPSVPLPPIGGIPTPVTSQPVIAPSATSPVVTAALSKPDDGSERTRAIGMLVALIVVTGWLTLTERGGRKPHEELGVGRFRSIRNGPPPSI